jgi:hypothetical protein
VNFIISRKKRAGHKSRLGARLDRPARGELVLSLPKVKGFGNALFPVKLRLAAGGPSGKAIAHPHPDNKAQLFPTKTQNDKNLLTIDIFTRHDVAHDKPENAIDEAEFVGVSADRRGPL